MSYLCEEYKWGWTFFKWKTLGLPNLVTRWYMTGVVGVFMSFTWGSLVWLKLHNPHHCCVLLRTTPFLPQTETRPLWVEGEIQGSLGITSSIGTVRAWHCRHEWMFPQSSTAHFITKLILMSYQCWCSSWNNPTISNLPQQWQLQTPSTSRHPPSLDVSLNSINTDVVKLQSFHNRAPATPWLLQCHVYIIIHWTSFHLPSLWTLSHHKCPSSHHCIPSPLTVLTIRDRHSHL